MKTKGVFFCFLLLVVVDTSCEKSFAPKIEKYDELLVVDGWLTDAPGPYTVKLSKSAQLKQLVQYNPYGGCQLTITDDMGGSFPLTEKSTGVYKTDSVSFRTVPGRKYKLTILTKDGEEVQSTEEQLLNSIAIDKVYEEFQHKSDPKKYYGRDGYQFYVDVGTLPTRSNFFLWKLDCTYKFRADYEISAYYYNGKRYEVVKGDTLRECYRNVDILELYMLSTKDLQQPIVKRFPLNYEDNYTKALTIRYSLFVKQFAINEASFNYWSTIKKMRDEQGDLFTQQPYQAKNNVYNVTNPDKPVLGYFTVAGYSEKRIFVKPPVMESRHDTCSIQGDPVKHLDDFLWKHPALWPYFFPDEKYGDRFLDQECIDCRRIGVLEKPNFWID
jgi:hypothetical protein